METREEDFVRPALHGHHCTAIILFFTNRGRVYWLKVHQIPEAGSRRRQGDRQPHPDPYRRAGDRGAPGPAVHAGPLHPDGDEAGGRQEDDLEAYSHPRPSGIIAITLEEGDELIAAEVTDGQRDVFLGTKDGCRSGSRRPMCAISGAPARASSASVSSGERGRRHGIRARRLHGSSP